ncbi:hypothetical protein [Flavicella marina]|uniref:hypothetical protein n=1 Tax=Flavicella marina TaxID=1475951 RepID=UPI00126439BA|nr:hypothetical protein [Flavicella marina]
MKEKRTPKKMAILIIVSIVLLLIFTNFDLTKELLIKGENSNYLIPVTILFPILFVFLYANILYLKFSFKEGKTLIQKIIYGLINVSITAMIFGVGFQFWKYSQGDIDVAFNGEVKKAFELNFRNLFFWVFYQSILMAYGLSILKIGVSKMKK